MRVVDKVRHRRQHGGESPASCDTGGEHGGESPVSCDTGGKHEGESSASCGTDDEYKTTVCHGGTFAVKAWEV